MDIREKIADLQHDQWVGWMKYLFSKCYFKDGCYVTPPLTLCFLPLAR